MREVYSTRTSGLMFYYALRGKLLIFRLITIAMSYYGCIQFGHCCSQQLFPQACKSRLLLRIRDLIRRILMIKYHRIIILSLLIDFNWLLIIVLLHGCRIIIARLKKTIICLLSTSGRSSRHR